MSNIAHLFQAKKSSYCFRNCVSMQVELKILLVCKLTEKFPWLFVCSKNKQTNKKKRKEKKNIANNILHLLSWEIFSPKLQLKSGRLAYLLMANFNITCTVGLCSWLISRATILILDKLCFHLEDRSFKELKISPTQLLVPRNTAAIYPSGYLN